MGAAASVETNSRVAMDDAANAVQDTANKLEGQINIPDGAPAVAAPALNLDGRIESIGNSVGPAQRESVLKILHESKGMLPVDQVGAALDEIEKVLPTVEGASVLVAIAGAVGTASNMAPEIIGLIGGAVLSLGEHLPYLGIAAGAIGAIVYTFRLSKDQDENVKTVTTWLQSVKDWLFLVANKVEISAAASTVPLFEALQDAILNISTQMDERNRKWRITKMLSSTQFERDFNRVKTAILELKTALRDFLDEETQNRQEAALQNISTAQLETNEQLTSMNDQLTEIRNLLKEQAEQQAKAQETEKSNSLAVKDEEEAIFQNIQRAASTDGDVGFISFVRVFESFFYNASDMPPEQKRALKLSLLKENELAVSKPSWIKFYRQWTASGLNMEQFLVNIAEANPTVYQKGLKLSEEAIAKAKGALAAKGIHNADDLKRKAAEHMKSMGINLPFGKKKGEAQDPPAAEAVPVAA